MAQMLLEGPGALKRYTEFLEAFCVTRPLVVGGQRYQGRFGACAHFSGYHPNPDLADAENGARLFREENCDCLISIGGGSAIDTAKAIKYHLDDHRIPHLAIPGTAGTGSETTRFAVVYVNRKKKSLDFPWLLPDAAILDGELLATLPAYHQRACLMDALAQCIESFWARSATEESRALAAQGIQTILENRLPYLTGQNPAAAQQVLKGAYLSGRAIEITRTTAPHAMSYQLTQMYGIAHGHAVGLTLPWVWRTMQNEPAMKKTLDQLDALMHGDGPQKLLELMTELELTAPTAAIEDVEALAASVDVQRLSNHPVAFSCEDLARIYRLALTLE